MVFIRYNYRNNKRAYRKILFTIGKKDFAVGSFVIF